MGVYSPAQHWHRVEGALADLGETGTRVIRDNNSVSLAWVMEDSEAEGDQYLVIDGLISIRNIKNMRMLITPQCNPMASWLCFMSPNDD